MAFIFVSCIHSKKVTVSSLHTDLMFFACRRFSSLQWTFKSHASCAMIYSLSPFPLNFVAFCIYQHTNFSTLFSSFHSGFFMCIKTGGWKEHLPGEPGSVIPIFNNYRISPLSMTACYSLRLKCGHLEQLQTLMISNVAVRTSSFLA